MLRRLVCLVLLVAPIAAGCGPLTRKPYVDPYTKVSAGMNEQQVVKLLGTPQQRRGMITEDNRQVIELRYLGHNRMTQIYLHGGRVVGKNRI